MKGNLDEAADYLHRAERVLSISPPAPYPNPRSGSTSSS
jgi:hypothetical protein